MPDDMDTPPGDEEYGDGSTATMQDDAKPDADADENKAGDEQEAILPKSILAGKDFNVGDEVTLKITAMHDQQISVAYAPSKDKDANEPDKAAVPAGMDGTGDSDY